MLVQSQAKKFHLTYCLNVHPGETWADNLAAIREYALQVRTRLRHAGEFGLGLRLSARAAAELAVPERTRELKAFLAAEGLYVFTVNAFPYGQFHRQPVREDVYAPDWRTPERLDYTLKTAAVLAQLLPENVSGSISTLPGSFRAWITKPEELRQIHLNLLRTVAGLRNLEDKCGKRICLAIEPEPACLWESTAEIIRLLQTTLPELAAGTELSGSKQMRISPEEIGKYLGICLDCCHAAVRFEDPAAALRELLERGVNIAKIQFSAAPGCACTDTALEQMSRFHEGTYLHQSYIRNPETGTIQAFTDLPEAVAAARELPETCELRSHFHLPLTFNRTADLHSTRVGLDHEFFSELQKLPDGSHLETETYTYAVLPDNLRPPDITDMLAAELDWARQNIL